MHINLFILVSKIKLLLSYKKKTGREVTMECKSYRHPKFYYLFSHFGNFLKPRLGGIKVNLSQLIIERIKIIGLFTGLFLQSA